MKYRGLLVLAVPFLGVSIAVGQTIMQKKQEDIIPYEDLRSFSEVFGRVKNNYVEPVEDKALLESAIRGMLSGLDPHSSYLNPIEYKDLQESTAGKFGGLGIEVSMEDGFVKVVAPIDDTPAQRAGIQAGDLIIRLDDKPVKGMSLNEAVTMMRGKPGSGIELTIVREGTEGPLKLVIERDEILVKSVRYRVLEKDYGYVRISNFQLKTGYDLLESLDKLKKENKTPLRGLVLDLRNNPGGVLSSAVEVSNAFLNEGLIVYTEGKTESAAFKYNATPGDAIDGVPMVVLINNGSASASEIVAGALQDHVRAIIMGTPSFGKGSVQTLLEFQNGSAIKLTTARYYTPKGRSIQAEGIKPDIPVKRLRFEESEKPNALEPLKEANLSRHLTKPGETEGKTKPGTKGKEKEEIKEDLAKTDYELFEALNLLKALNILNIRS